MNDDLGKLNLVELLERLEPIPEPAAISMWPQTVGWAWVGVTILLVLAWLARRWVLHRRANAYRRAALIEIAAARNDPAALASILRRTAIAAFPRHDVAGLYGEQWLAFLDRTYGGRAFTEGDGRQVATAPYSGNTNLQDLSKTVVLWVKRHRANQERPA